MHWFLILDTHRYAFTEITSDAAAAAAETAARILYTVVTLRMSFCHFHLSAKKSPFRTDAASYNSNLFRNDSS